MGKKQEIGKSSTKTATKSGQVERRHQARSTADSECTSTAQSVETVSLGSMNQPFSKFN